MTAHEPSATELILAPCSESASGSPCKACDPYRQAFEQADVGMVIIDLSGVLRQVNRAVCDLLGYEPEQLLGLRLDSLKHPEEVALDADQFVKLITGELSRVQSERRYLQRSGETIWVQSCVALVRDSAGQPSYLVGHIHSVDDRRKAESDLRTINSQLARLASFDGLTGLLNRRTLLTGFEQMWHTSRDERAPLSCVILDIDHFKSINDCHGHAAGDEVLRHVGGVLQSSLRPHDLGGRWGGEEFLFVCKDMRAEEAFKLAESIRLAISQLAITWRDQQIPVTVSLGVAQRTVVCHEPHELLALADEQLYAAKRMGRNCTCVSAEVSHDEADEDSVQTAVFRPTNK